MACVFIPRINAQVLFFENFEGVINTATKLPANWQERGSSLDSIYYVGDSTQANSVLNQSAVWKIPAHGKFVMTNDVRCSYEKGFGYCDKSKDRLILPMLSMPTFSGSLILNFETFFTGKLGSMATVEVSLDGGVNWVKEYEFTSDQNKWQSISVNLTKYIGESNVLISFLYNDNNLVRDGLALDNVVIKKQTPWKDVSIDFVSAAKYSMIPISQIDSIPLDVILHNNGSLLLDTTDVKIQIYEKSDPKKTLYFSSKKIVNLKVNDTISVNLGAFLPKVKNKTYVIQHWVKTKRDTVLFNDSLIIPIQISQTSFARDNSIATTSFDLTSANTITLGSKYSFIASSYLDSIYFETINASIGTSVQAYVFPIVNGKVLLNELGKSDIYTLSKSNESVYLKIKSLNLGRVLLDTGSYLIAIQKTNGGGSIGIKMSDNYYQDNTVFMRIGQVSFQTLNSYFSGTKKTVPIIRAYTSPFCKLSTKINKINTKCKFSTGELAAKPTNGHSPYTYLWSTGSTDSIINKVGVGNYNLRITDYFNCIFDSIGISMVPFAKPIIVIDSLSHPLCYNTATGYISITTNNPGNISKIKWNGVFTNQLFLNKIKSGDYTVDVIDGNNCEDSLKVNLINPDSLTVVSFVKEETSKSKGIISLNVSGGNSPYRFRWTDSVLVKNRSELVGDSTYSVTITDTNSCKKTVSIYVGRTLSINDAEMRKMMIYPNPISDVLNLYCETEINTISVYDLIGNKYIEFTNNPSFDNHYSFNLSELNRGIYILLVEQNGKNEQFKFVKN